MNKNLKMSVIGFSRYRVSKNGSIEDIANDKVINHTTESKSGIVIVNVQNDSWRWTKVSVARLVLMAYRPCSEHWWYGYAIVHYLDGDKTNVCLENLEWRFTKYRPLRIPGINISFDEYVSIPGFSSYEINGSGLHRNRNKKLPLSNGYLSDSGYLKVRINDDKGISRNISVHRLLALTFLEHPVDTSDLVVNHKDGNKLNLSIDNLEWITTQENNVHAWKTGLQTGRNGSILVMHHKTREVRCFTNFTQLLRSLELPETTVRRWLTDNDKNLTLHRDWFIKYASDNRDWPQEDQLQFQKEAREGIPVSIKNITTGVVESYLYVNEVARKFGVDRGIIDRLLRHSQVMPYKGWLIRYTSDKEWPVYSDRELFELSQVQVPGKRIYVTDPISKKNQMYSSIAAFEKASGISKYQIRNALAGNNRTIYDIRYAA